MTDGFQDRSMREFLVEASEIVEAMATGFSLLDEQRRRGRIEPARINDVFRCAHSLKGLAGMFNIDSIASLAHEMETLLDSMRLGRLSADEPTVRLLYRCADAFASALTSLNAGDDVQTGTFEGLRNDIGKLIGRPAQPAQEESVLAVSAQALSVLTEYEEHRLAENLRERRPVFRVFAPLPFATFETDLAALNAALGEQGEVITTLPSAEGGRDGINFDLLFASTDPIESLAALLMTLSPSYEIERVDRAVEKKEATAPDTAAVVDEGASDTVRQLADTVRVDISKLDELMGIVGELVLARGGLGRVTDELKTQLGYRGIAVDLHRLVRTMDRRISDLQGAIMQVRMIPLGQIFDRLSRVVRRAAGELGKDIDLVVAGEETELDKLIVEELVDPLMHLVRNAIDHGIETPEERAAAGKPPTGTVRIDAYPRGNHVVLEIRDDGRGIDEVAVRRTALERGVVAEDEVGTLSRRELWNLVFDPGFSTKKVVTETSGRGVGLDVVKHNIARLSGIIDVASDPGQGTHFMITLPITLAIIQALIVRTQAQTFALPLASVLEIVLVDEDQLCTVDAQEMVQVRGDTLPLLRLDRVFELPRVDDRASAEAAEGIGYVAVVGLAQRRVAIFVDDVTGQQDIVIKSLGTFLSGVRGFAGATQLGDHETILVLDVAALVQEYVDKRDRRTPLSKIA